MKKIILFLLIAISVHAQVNTEWVARYNRLGNGVDYPEALKIDGLGNIYVAGASQGTGGLYGCTLIKYSPSGTVLWVQHYNGPDNGNDGINGIELDNAGNVYATGVSWTDSTAREDCLTLKYNTNGVLQWSARYNGYNLNDYGHKIAVDNAGNVYIGGKSDSISINAGGFLTIKYNSMGVQQWAVRVFGQNIGDDNIKSIAVDNASNVYICGTNKIDQNNIDYVTIKYNTNGAQQWLARYNGPAGTTDDVSSMVVDASGNVYVTGSSYANGSGSDCATIKYNTNGTQQWVARYNGAASDYDEGLAIAVDASGNVFVTGRSAITQTNYDMLTLKYSSTGIQQWANTFNGIGNRHDAGASITLDNAGNAYITGYTQTDTLSKTDYTTIRYSANGVQQWVKNYDGGINSFDYSYVVQLDAFNNVIVTGYSMGTGTGIDFATIKYSQIIGVTQISNAIPESFSLSQNYPNPFNPTTNIKFDIPQTADIRLVIYNILGREVSILVNENMNPGSYSVSFDAVNLPSGVYFYTLSAGTYIKTKKMLLIK